jgi:hypothetical protein
LCWEGCAVLCVSDTSVSAVEACTLAVHPCVHVAVKCRCSQPLLPSHACCWRRSTAIPAAASVCVCVCGWVGGWVLQGEATVYLCRLTPGLYHMLAVSVQQGLRGLSAHCLCGRIRWRCIECWSGCVPGVVALDTPATVCWQVTDALYCLVLLYCRSCTPGWLCCCCVLVVVSGSRQRCCWCLTIQVACSESLGGEQELLPLVTERECCGCVCWCAWGCVVVESAKMCLAI